VEDVYPAAEVHVVIALDVNRRSEVLGRFDCSDIILSLRIDNARINESGTIFKSVARVDSVFLVAPSKWLISKALVEEVSNRKVGANVDVASFS